MSDNKHMLNSFPLSINVHYYQLNTLIEPIFTLNVVDNVMAMLLLFYVAQQAKVLTR